MIATVGNDRTESGLPTDSSPTGIWLGTKPRHATSTTTAIKSGACATTDQPMPHRDRVGRQWVGRPPHLPRQPMDRIAERNGRLITLIILGDPGHAKHGVGAMRIGADQLADLVVAEL